MQDPETDGRVDPAGCESDQFRTNMQARHTEDEAETRAYMLRTTSSLHVAVAGCAKHWWTSTYLRSEGRMTQMSGAVLHDDR